MSGHSSRNRFVALFALSMTSFAPLGGFAQDTTQAEVPTLGSDATAAAPYVAPDAGPAAEVVALIDGIVSVSIAADLRIVDTAGESVRQTMLAHPDAPEVIHTTLITGQPGADPAVVTAAITDRLATIDSVTAASHAGTPVWIVSGEARRAPDGSRPGRSRPHAQLMVTQSCLQDGGPVMLGVVTTPTRSAPPVLEAILSTLSLTLPDDAIACPPALGAAIMALPIGVIDHPAEPVPLVLVPHERFGLGLLAPEDMRLRRDRDDGTGRQEYWLTNAAPETDVGSDIVLLVLTQDQRDAITSEPVGSPGFLAALEQLDEMPRAPTGETLQLGNTVLQRFQGQMTITREGVDRTRRATYLFSEQASATGLHIWLAIVSTDVPEADAAALEQAVLDGLSLADPVLFDGQPPQTLLNGAVRIAVAPGQVVDARQERGSLARLALSDADSPGETQVFFAVEMRDNAAPDLAGDLERRMTRIMSVGTQVIDGVPVRVMDGGTDRFPDMSRPDAGQTSPARIIVTRDCLPGAGPMVIGVLATRAYLDRVGGFDPVIGAVTLAMPEGSAPCPDALDQALASVPLTGVTAQPDPTPDPTPVPPGLATGPEPGAWEHALAQGTAPALWTYLKAHPEGAHAAQARAMLRALAQPAPAPPAAPVAPRKQG